VLAFDKKEMRACGSKEEPAADAARITRTALEPQFAGYLSSRSFLARDTANAMSDFSAPLRRPEATWPRKGYPGGAGETLRKVE